MVRQWATLYLCLQFFASSYSQLSEDWRDTLIRYYTKESKQLPLTYKIRDSVSLTINELKEFQKQSLYYSNKEKKFFIYGRNVSFYDIKFKYIKNIEYEIILEKRKYLTVLREGGAKKEEGNITYEGFIGKYKSYYKSGELKWEGYFESVGKKAGEWKKYNKDGKLIRTIKHSKAP